MSKLTLLDLAKRTDNDTTVGIVEATTQNNALLALMPFRGITGVSYKFGRRVGLPTVSFRGINQGIDASKGKIDQILVETKDIGGRSEVDKLLAERDPRGINALRAEEDAGFVAAMGNMFNLKAYYGSAAGSNGLEFDGIATIMDDLSKSTVLSAGGSGAGVQTSVYALAFGDATSVQGKLRGVEGLLGNGKNISAMDMGLQYVDDADSKKFLAYTTEFEFAPGIAIYDERSIGRICNIDNSSNKVTIPLMNELIVEMHPYKVSAFFVSKATYLTLQALKSTSFSYKQEDRDIFKSVLTFDGIPIFIDENIVATEAVVS